MSEEKSNVQAKLPISVMAIVSLVIGIIAFSTSFVPIVNNASAFFAVFGAIFGFIGIVGVFKGKKRSKVLAIIALAVNVVAFVVVLATQNMWGQALNNVAGNPASGTKGSSEAHFGESITMNNDLEICVVSVEEGLKNYDGTPITKVVVKYQNNGNKEISYNTYDWKGENSQGNQTNTTVYTGGGLNSNNDNLNSGKLSPNGTVSGSLYFSGDVSKMIYNSSFVGDAKATWTK